MEPPSTPGAGGFLSYSCVTCRQRKVKCDRRSPCSNCAKAEKECTYVAPVRGRRKRTKRAREGLHARLKRYEEMLKQHGAKVEPPDELDRSDSDAASQPDAELEQSTASPGQGNRYAVETFETKPKLIKRDGTSIYYDCALWSNLGEEYQHPEIDILEPTGEMELMGEPVAEETEMLMVAVQSCKAQNLASLHLPFPILLKFKEIYVDRIDPLQKILHIPTFWTEITDALRDRQHMSKSLESLIFAFYFAASTAMKDDESQSLFGTERKVVFARYRMAARQALVSAGFLSTSCPMTLLAYTMFMLSTRNCYRAAALFSFSGVAIRLARKMGLHRDGSTLGLSPFETEMRRRLWWHIAFVDYRIADVLGTTPSMDLSAGVNVKTPMNLEDEDLTPDMTEMPEERNGITTVALTIVKCTVVDALRQIAHTAGGEVRWDVLNSMDISVTKKESIIRNFQDKLERKFLRYCDPSSPFHTLLSIIVRSSICKMNVYAHRPRYFASSQGLQVGGSIIEQDREVLFYNATKLLEYTAMLQSGQNGLDKFVWQIGTSFLWNTVLHVLIEARRRKTGPDVDKAWQLIRVVFQRFSNTPGEPTQAVYSVLGKWTMEAWDEYVAASKAEGLPEPQAPGYINMIRRYRNSSSTSRNRDVPADPPSKPANRGMFSHNRMQSQIDQSNLTNTDSFESYEFPDLLSLENDPNEWIQWEQLLNEQSAFVQGNGL